MPINPRITQKQLAKLAGVSHTTVSLALRDHPRISNVIKKQILDLAKKHGYRPDPSLSALNAYRLGKSETHYQSTLLWITNFSSSDGWRHGKQMEGYFLGAQSRAKELGYKLEQYWIADPKMSSIRLSQILLNRGCTGLLVAPQPTPYTKLKFKWAEFSSVTFGYSLAEPQLHMVMNHQFRNMQRVVRELRIRGYCKIGISMPSEYDERVDHSYLSGFWIETNNINPSITVPPLLSDNFDFSTFKAWFQQHEPDVVITATNWARIVEDWLTKLKLKVPQDVGLAVPSVPFKENRFSGIDENVKLIGSIAVDTLVGMIHRNEKGVPQFPLRILVEGIWHEGETIKKPSTTLEGV
jgi:DNA-binding LacI/PurR family transcriptional regulator